MKLLKLLFAVCLVGCGAKHPAESTRTDVTELTDKVANYHGLIMQAQDEAGFVGVDTCDSTLFSGLAGAAGASVNLTQAEDPDHPGRWYRRPVAYQECYASGASRSTVSRDQLLGVYWWAWRTKDLGALERLWAYGAARNWVMGDDAVGGAHTLLNGNMVRLLADAVYALGGENHQSARLIPYDWSGTPTGFEAHLQVLQVLLAGELNGALGDRALAVLQTQAERQPQNPLFQAAYHRYTDGDQSAAITLLLNEAWWPANRLPSSADRCEAWLPQRDYGDDWAPCDSGRGHSGADLLFVAGLIL